MCFYVWENVYESVSVWVYVAVNFNYISENNILIQQALHLWTQPTMDRKYLGGKKSQKVPKSKTWICHVLSPILNPCKWSDVYVGTPCVAYMQTLRHFI